MSEAKRRQEFQERRESPDYGIRVAIIRRTADGGDKRGGQCYLEDITTGALRWGLVEQSNPRHIESLYHTQKKGFILLLRARAPQYMLADREVAAGEVHDVAQEFGPVTDIESIAYLYDDAQALGWFEKHKDEHKVPSWLTPAISGSSSRTAKANQKDSQPDVNERVKQYLRKRRITQLIHSAPAASDHALKAELDKVSVRKIAKELHVSVGAVGGCSAWREISAIKKRLQNKRASQRIGLDIAEEMAVQPAAGDISIEDAAFQDETIARIHAADADPETKQNLIAQLKSGAINAEAIQRKLNRK